MSALLLAFEKGNSIQYKINTTKNLLKNSKIFNLRTVVIVSVIILTFFDNILSKIPVILSKTPVIDSNFVLVENFSHSLLKVLQEFANLLNKLNLLFFLKKTTIFF